MRRTLALLALTALLPIGLRAQTCEALPSFAAGPVQLAATGSFESGAKLLGAGVGFGGNGAFGKFGLGSLSFDNGGGSALDISARAGYQVPLTPSRRSFLCPIVGVGYVSGPNNIAGSGIDLSEFDLGAGISAGVAVPTASAVTIVPAASLALDYADDKASDQSGNSASASTTFGELVLGLGFVFSNTVGAGPSVTIPIGLQGSSASFSITFAINFGSP